MYTRISTQYNDVFENSKIRIEIVLDSNQNDKLEENEHHMILTFIHNAHVITLGSQGRLITKPHPLTHGYFTVF